VSTGYPILVLSLQVMLALPLLRQFGRFLVDPRELCSPLTVVAGGFVGLYVASYYFTSDHDRDAFLTVDGYFTLLLLAVLAEYALWAGFVLGSAVATRRELPFHRPTVCRYGVALIGAGLAARAVFIQKSGGFLAFFGAPHGAGGIWADTSAYLYALSTLMFPAMCLLGGMWVRDGLPGALPRVAFLGGLLYCAFEAFVFGNRGDTIRLFLLLLLPPLFLARRLHVSRRSILMATAGALSVVLLFPYLREALYLGAEKSLVEAVSDVFAEPTVSLDPAKVTGQELFYAAALVAGTRERGIYDYGYTCIYPFINLVPRAWWPDKPYFRDWSIQPQLVKQSAGWTVAGGAATTGVADAFSSFSWFSLIVWLLGGWWGGMTWRRATTTNSVIDVACLWAFLMIAVFFVTQGYIAAWHAWLFHMVPIWFLGLLMPAMAARPDLGRCNLAPHQGRSGLPAPAP
jgi:hypothetical protein